MNRDGDDARDDPLATEQDQLRAEELWRVMGELQPPRAIQRWLHHCPSRMSKSRLRMRRWRRSRSDSDVREAIINALDAVWTAGHLDDGEHILMECVAEYLNKAELAVERAHSVVEHAFLTADWVWAVHKRALIAWALIVGLLNSLRTYSQEGDVAASTTGQSIASSPYAAHAPPSRLAALYSVGELSMAA